TLYFFWQNLIGIHESSDKAVKIMILTTLMAVVLIGWCGATLLTRGPVNRIPIEPNFQPKMNYDKNEEDDPLGFLRTTPLATKLRNPEIAEVTENTIVILDNQGRREEFRLGPGARATLDRKEIPISELKPGMRVEVEGTKERLVGRINAFSNSGIN